MASLRASPFRNFDFYDLYKERVFGKEYLWVVFSGQLGVGSLQGGMIKRRVYFMFWKVFLGWNI